MNNQVFNFHAPIMNNGQLCLLGMAMLAYLVGVGLICGIYIFLYNKIRSFREKRRGNELRRTAR